MYIIHRHPPRTENGEQEYTDVQALHRACLCALRRYRHVGVPVPPGSARDSR